MADMEAVYRYGSPDGEVLARHEIGPDTELDTELPSVGDTIPLPGSSGGEKRFVVTAVFPGVSGGVSGEVPSISSRYIIVVEAADQ